MATLISEQQIGAVFYAIIRKSPTEKQLKMYADAFESRGIIAIKELVSTLIRSDEAIALYGNKKKFDIMSEVFVTAHGRNFGEVEFKLWLNEAAKPIEVNLFRIIDELISNKAPWPQLNYDWTQSGELNYPVQRVTDREHLIDKGHDNLFPGSSTSGTPGSGVTDIQGIFHILGAGLTQDVTDFWVVHLNNGTKTLLQATEKFIADRAYLSNVMDNTFINRLFDKGFERAPSQDELNKYLGLLSSGSSRAEVAIKILQSLRDSTNEQDQLAQQHLLAASHDYAPGELPALAYQEQIAALYLAAAGRGINAQALFGYSRELAAGKSYEEMVKLLLNSSEFTRYSSHLNGEPFVQKIYKSVYGLEADNDTVQRLLAYGSKESITSHIINDLLKTDPISNDEFQDQFQFLFKIAYSLGFKNNAVLTNTDEGTPRGNINSGVDHTLSNTELAILEKITINLISSHNIDLTYAANVKDITITGSSEGMIKISDHLQNEFTKITINGHILDLHTGGAGEIIYINKTVDIASSPSKYTLGGGDDFLAWEGNNASAAGNKISKNITADGGDGNNKLSANFITFWTETTIRKGLNGNPDTKEVKYSSNLDQFKNFSLIDLAGYIGQVSGITYTVSTDGSITRTIDNVKNNTFDYGLFLDNASIISGGNVNDIGKSGFSITNANDFKATAGWINVININQAAANIYINNRSQINHNNQEYRFNVKDDVTHFNLFTNQKVANDQQKEYAELHEGEVISNYAGTFLFTGNNLTEINVDTTGSSEDKTAVSLKLQSTKIDTINISGDNLIALSVDFSSSLSNNDFVVNASDAAGINFFLADSVTKNITVIGGHSENSFKILDSNNAPVNNNGSIKFIGGDGSDFIDIDTGITAMGGEGIDLFNIVRPGKGEHTLYDFNKDEDVIGLKNLDIYISNKKAGEKVPLTEHISGGNSLADYGYIENLYNPNTPLTLTKKIGVVSTLDEHLEKNTYFVVDLNNNGVYDTTDSLIKVTGQPDTQQLAETLFY
ncbi:DUF4214 domain-containing protein [Serratia plymuthica]|uniref:DUF4214 domain-containing protein n=1 Tax=Serratia plymuthica TaxID=82996 RepID=UPI002DBEBAEC|nr:DUF4214 domain-containing protein [Serratia plymuthica]MEB6539891.1 DUF4214 domain-containing protein [Serratia plymuthica]